VNDACRRFGWSARANGYPGCQWLHAAYPQLDAQTVHALAAAGFTPETLAQAGPIQLRRVPGLGLDRVGRIRSAVLGGRQDG
jgi:predicted DNA-binding helix-hairpin-helix protein